ncbi:MAG: SDR family oxidoreductase [Gemmataceae bacterium]
MAKAKGPVEITTEQFGRGFKTNVYATFWVTTSVLAHLPAGVAVINTASIQAYEPSQKLIDYARTKAAIVSAAESMASVGRQAVGQWKSDARGLAPTFLFLAAAEANCVTGEVFGNTGGKFPS